MSTSHRSVTDTVIGTGERQVHVVDGVDPSLLVAVLDDCPPDVTRPACGYWYVAVAGTGEGTPSSRRTRAICRVADLGPDGLAPEGC